MSDKDICMCLDEHIDALRRIDELCTRFKRSRDTSSLACLNAVLASFEPEKLHAFFNNAESVLNERKREAKRSLAAEFRKNFKEAAKNNGWKLSCISSEPPEFKVGPFVLSPNFSEAKASVYYAGMLLCSGLSLNLDIIFDALEKEYCALEDRGLKNGLPEGADPEDAKVSALFAEEFFLDVFRAYKACLKFKGGSLGTRLELSELYPMLALERQKQSFSLLDENAEFSEYSKIQFCWDLVRLRRCGGFSQHGMRLYLGTATIGSTKSKDRVYLLDDGVGMGQYYLSIWFDRHK